MVALPSVARRLQPTPGVGRAMTDSFEFMPFIRRVARQAAWAPATVLALHEVGARVFGHEPYIDPTMHLLGGAAMAFFFRQASSLPDGFLGAPSQVALDLLAFGLAIAVALFWEFGEFAADHFFGTQVQRGLGNTMRDLACGLAGAVFYLGCRRVARRFREGTL